MLLKAIMRAYNILELFYSLMGHVKKKIFKPCLDVQFFCIILNFFFQNYEYQKKKKKKLTLCLDGLKNINKITKNKKKKKFWGGAKRFWGGSTTNEKSLKGDS
jgi:hypothetical protein